MRLLFTENFFKKKLYILSSLLLLSACGKNPDLDRNSRDTNSPEITNSETPSTSSAPETKSTEAEKESKTPNPALSDKPSIEQANPSTIPTEKILKDQEGVTSSSGKYRMNIKWESALIAKKDLNAKIIFTDITGYQKLAVSISSFDPIMVRMGHGTSKKRLKFEVSEEGSHCFNATGIYFSMGELWTITIVAKIEDQFETFAIDALLP